MTDRADRIAVLIKREIAVILQGEIGDPRISSITITRAEVTRDLKLARIFYTVFPGEENPREIARGLKSASSFIRTELAERVSLKFIPRISFREDPGGREKESIDRILERIEEEHASGDNEREGT